MYAREDAHIFVQCTLVMSVARDVAAARSLAAEMHGGVWVAAGRLMLELETKVIRRYAKILQSQRRPLLESLKASTSAFTFNTQLRHDAKQALTHGK